MLFFKTCSVVDILFQKAKRQFFPEKVDMDRGGVGLGYG